MLQFKNYFTLKEHNNYLYFTVDFMFISQQIL